MLKATTSVLVLMIIGTPALSACAETRPSNSESEIAAVKTICEAARLAVGVNEIRVTLDADFISDRKERSLLQDESCSQIVVIPFDGPKTVKDKEYQAFARILDANPLQVGLVKARVMVYGALRREAPDRYRLDVIRYIRSEEQNAR